MIYLKIEFVLLIVLDRHCDDDKFLDIVINFSIL